MLIPAERFLKVNVSLADRQIAMLDSLSLDIRIRHRSVVTRAELVRALIDALEKRRLSTDDVMKFVERAWVPRSRTTKTARP